MVSIVNGYFKVFQTSSGSSNYYPLLPKGLVASKTSLLISEYSTGYSEKHFRQKSVSSSVRSIPCLLLHLNLNSFSLISKGIASIKVSLCSYLACFKLHQDHQTFPLVVCSILLFEISLILSLL